MSRLGDVYAGTRKYNEESYKARISNAEVKAIEAVLEGNYELAISYCVSAVSLSEALKEAEHQYDFVKMLDEHDITKF